MPPSQSDIFSRSEHDAPAPDLLRRFVPTPYQTIWLIGAAEITVETNHQEVLCTFSSPVEESSASVSKAIRLKVVVDSELALAEHLAPLVIKTPTIVWGRVRDMLFAFDNENRELLVFMNRFQPAEFSAFVLDLLHDERA
jgi:hypothetical protein